jgi:hypothetical protein
VTRALVHLACSFAFLRLKHVSSNFPACFVKFHHQTAMLEERIQTLLRAQPLSGFYEPPLS